MATLMFRALSALHWAIWASCIAARVRPLVQLLLALQMYSSLIPSVIRNMKACGLSPGASVPFPGLGIAKFPPVESEVRMLLKLV